MEVVLGGGAVVAVGEKTVDGNVVTRMLLVEPGASAATICGWYDRLPGEPLRLSLCSPAVLPETIRVREAKEPGCNLRAVDEGEAN